jgi:molybdopterin/thiamine biosynthesis adenylyltransferase/molybdopterin converting factor small subunit
MRITVRYLAQLRQVVGRPSEGVDVEAPCSVRAFLARLAEREAGLRALLLSAEGQVRPSILVFLGSEQVRTGEDPPLKDGDALTLLTPIAGGSLEDRYSWQLNVAGFGVEGQRRLASASVLVSRCGGVGGLVAYELAAAGVGRLLLAHAGPLRADDLNRQLLMEEAGLGRLRVEQAAERLRAFNSAVRIETVAENVGTDNVARLVGSVDLVVSCAPLFEERLLMNREAVRQRKPLIDCAMYELEVQLTTVLPGRSPCLACLYPEPSPLWERRFPVFGAVAGTVACLGAMEAIKVLADLGEPLAGQLLLGDLRDMSFQRVGVRRNPDCPVCGGMGAHDARV